MLQRLCRPCINVLRCHHFFVSEGHRQSSHAQDKPGTEAAAATDGESQHTQKPSAAAGKSPQAADAGTRAAADAIEAPAAAILVRDSTSLKPRLLQPPLATNPAGNRSRRSRRRAAADTQDTSDAAQQQLAEEQELQYFTEDVSAAAGLEAGFAAARILQRKDAKTADLSPQEGGPAAAAAAEAADGQSVDASSAAELEMQQLEELRQQRGGILAPEELEVVQVAKQRAAKKLLSMEVLARAIMNALEVGKKYGVDPKVLLTPRIAEMRTDLLQARAAQIQRMLPDAQLQEELLARGAEEVSGQITRIIFVFRRQLGMDAPPRMLTQPGTFAKALRLPIEQLKSHLEVLQRMLGSKLQARELAASCTDTIFSPAFPQLMQRVDRVAASLQLTQAEAAEMVLRYPFLARTNKQLQHMEQMIQAAPSALRLPDQQVLACFIKHPDLFRFSNSNELSQKYQALAGVLQVSHNSGGQAEQSLPMATLADLLAICSSSKVRQAVSMTGILESLRTAAAIMGYTSPAQLLPMLLQSPKRNRATGTVYGTGRRPILSTLLQPARTLAERAGYVQQSRSLSRAEIAQLAQWFPRGVFALDTKTRKLKSALLQAQLLGTDIASEDKLDPRMVSVLKQNPMVANLRVDSVLQRIHAIQSALHTQHSEAKQIVLRVPHLFTYSTAVLQGLIQELVSLLGGNLEAARDLVLQDPKVLLLLRRYQAGTLQPKLALLQSLLNAPEPADVPAPPISASAAAAGAEAAVAAVSSRAANSSSSDSHGRKGVRQRPSGMWECRSYLVYDSKSQYTCQYSTPLEAACAQDLIRLAVKGPASSVNLDEHLYTAAEVEAVRAHLYHKREEWRQQQKQQQRQQHQRDCSQRNLAAEVSTGVPDAAEHRQPPPVAASTEAEGGGSTIGTPAVTSRTLVTAAEPLPSVGVAAADATARAAVAEAARAASSGNTTPSHGVRGVKLKGSEDQTSQTWQVRVSKSAWCAREFYATYNTALEAACAYDLVQLVLRGPGSAVNLPQSVYTPDQVRAMAVHVYYKQHHHGQRLQQQSQPDSEQMVQETTVAMPGMPGTSAGFTAGTSAVHGSVDQAASAAGEHAAAVFAAASAKQGVEEFNVASASGGTANYWQPSAAHDAADCLQQQSLPGCQQQGQIAIERLFLSCLSTKAGRDLLGLAADTGQARLQGLADILGISVSKLLSKALSSPGYLGRVLALSPQRMAAAASSLQQQLDLSEMQLKQVLQKAPWLLNYRQDVLQAKIAKLADAFASCCYAVQQVETMYDSTSRHAKHNTPTKSHGQLDAPEQQQSPVTGLDAVSCLQQAVLYAPQVLGLKVDRVAHRLQVLQDFCCHSQLAAHQHQQALHSSLAYQLHGALQSGSVGNWLIRGDAVYKLLEGAMTHTIGFTGSAESQRSVCGSKGKHPGEPFRNPVNLRDIMKQGPSRAAEVLEELGLRKS